LTTSEKWLQNKCIGWLKQQPDIWYLNVVGGGTQTAGVPDLLICKNGKFVAVELKRPKGSYRVSSIQRAQLERISRAGGVAVVINCFDDFLKVMEKL
jgi:hypothetical protein